MDDRKENIDHRTKENELRAGKAPENVLKRAVLSQIRTRREEVLGGAGIGCDCGSLSFPEAVVTCMQEAAVMTAGQETAQNQNAAESRNAWEIQEAWRGQDAAGNPSAGDSLDAVGQLQHAVRQSRLPMADLIQKCANNLAAGGADPVAAELALLLPIGTQEAQLRALMAEAEGKCRELSMQIIGGQTSVSSFVAAPVAVVTGYGRARCKEGGIPKKPAPGQDIVVSKWIGLQGTALLARWNQEKLLGRYPAQLVNEAMGFGQYLSVLPEAQAAMAFGVSAMHDASEGGILAAMWEMAESAGMGLTADMRRLPLRQETVEICEFCNVNPYQLLSGGCLVMTTPDGIGLTEVLKTKGIPAQVVGKITDSRDRILANAGEMRYLERPR